MQGYSLNGYLSAVMRRSQKTLLVEGQSDFSLIARVKGERAKQVGNDLPGVVDVTELIQDPICFGFGKKGIIKEITKLIASNQKFVSHASGKFGTIVDREWDGLNLDLQLQGPWTEPVQSPPNFVTRGHSVENYFFRLTSLEAYLRQFFSESLSQVFFNELRSRFPAIIRLAATYSLAIRHIGFISRSSDLISRRHIIWENGNYKFLSNICTDLLQRKIKMPENFDGLINNIILTTKNCSATEPNRWLCHGHLGTEAIWACIANLANEMGVTSEIAQQIERGNQAAKFKHAADHLVQENPTCSSPLNEVLDWLVEN